MFHNGASKGYGFDVTNFVACLFTVTYYDANPSMTSNHTPYLLGHGTYDG